MAKHITMLKLNSKLNKRTIHKFPPKEFLVFLLFFFMIYSVEGAIFENGTAYQHGNSTYLTNYTMSSDLVMDNLTIWDNGIIFNVTDNVSLIPASSLNITVVNWTAIGNTFNMTGDNSLVTFTIKINNHIADIMYGGVHKTAPFNATTTNTVFNYTYDTTIPTISSTMVTDANLNQIINGITNTEYTLLITASDTFGLNFSWVNITYPLGSNYSYNLAQHSTTQWKYTRWLANETGNYTFIFRINDSSDSKNQANLSTLRFMTGLVQLVENQGGGGGGTPISKNLTSLQVIGKQPQNMYAIVNTDKFSYNFGEPITTTTETWLKIGQDVYNSQSDVLINAQSVKVKILSHNVSFGEYELKQDSIGKYKAIIDNKLEEGQYTIQFLIKTYDGDIIKETQILVTRFSSITEVINTGNNNLNMAIIYIILTGLVIGTIIGVAVLIRRK